MAGTALSAAERFYRARRLGSTFTRVYLGIHTQRFISRRLRPPDMDARWRAFHRSSAHSIYDAAVELRGLILKGCQFLGTRADVLPPEVVQVLAGLQDRVPARPFHTVRRTVERELGGPLDRTFASFTPQPLASASLAQVHEARLRSGEAVAVKVQHPEIEALVRSDLANLRFLFRAVGLLERDFDWMPLIEELGTQVPLELDFLQEGRNAETLARHFSHRDDVVVPRIHWEHSTRRVLVMERMEGIKISHVAALRDAGIDPERVAQLLVQSYCEQVFRHGFFHADPHPGNLLVQPGPRLVFLDFGLAKDLPGGFRRGVLDVAGALLRGDAEALGTALLELGFETREGRPDGVRAAARAVLDAAIQLQDRSYLDRASVRQVGRTLAERLRQDPLVRIPSHLVLIARVLGLLSGVSHSLGSRVDLVRTLLPYALAPPEPAPAPV